MSRHVSVFTLCCLLHCSLKMQMAKKVHVLNALQFNMCWVTGDIPFSPGTVGVAASFGSTGDMFQGFPGDPDTGSRGSSSPSLESQYLSSVESFGSPPTTSAPQVSRSVSFKLIEIAFVTSLFWWNETAPQICWFSLQLCMKRSDVVGRVRLNSLEQTQQYFWKMC